MLLVYAAGAGARSIAGEEEDGTLDLLLAQPVSRTRVALEKYAVLVTGVSLLAAALWATLAVSAPAFDMHIGAARLAEGCLSLGLLALAFGSIAFLVTAAGGRRGLAAGIAGGLAGAMYLVNILAPEASALKRLEPLSLFHYYGVAPLAEGLPASHAAIFVATSLACLGVALAAFGRRDIG
jgi:ABC-2 type transport system permease protein